MPYFERIVSAVVHDQGMGFHRYIRMMALGMLVLTGLAAACPQAAHGSLAHEEGGPAEAPDRDAEGHNHDACEYDVSHTHAIRLSCAPDELSSHLLAGYDHVQAREARPDHGRMPCTRAHGASPAGPVAYLATVRLLL